MSGSQEFCRRLTVWWLMRDDSMIWSRHSRHWFTVMVSTRLSSMAPTGCRSVSKSRSRDSYAPAFSELSTKRLEKVAGGLSFGSISCSVCGMGFLGFNFILRILLIYQVEINLRSL